jgi:hypothetical protein
MRIGGSMNRTKTEMEFEGISDMVQITEDRCNDGSVSHKETGVPLVGLS